MCCFNQIIINRGYHNCKNLTSHRIILNQLYFNKLLGLISLNKRIKYFQSFTYIFKSLWLCVIITFSLNKYDIRDSIMWLYYEFLFLLSKDEFSIFRIIWTTSFVLTNFFHEIKYHNFQNVYKSSIHKLGRFKYKNTY